MNVRKFWITNGSNETIQFTNNESKIYLNNPTGLGINNAIVSNVYNEKLNVVSTDQDFAQIGGEMLFYDYANKTKYELYNEFITFLMSKPLTLYYQIPTETPQTFSIDVDLLSIDKTEVKTDGLLRCNFAFQPLSRWKGDEITLTGNNSIVEVVNNGHMPVGFEITFSKYDESLGRYTSFENPYIELYQDNNLYGIAKFTDEMTGQSQGNGFVYVYINSNDGEQNVILKRGDTAGLVVPNPLGYQDLSMSNGSIYVTFIKLAKGTSTLKFYANDGGVFSYDYEIKYRPLYRSV